ncbi:unnamed protein product, partial [Sphacelaria rigidula]
MTDAVETSWPSTLHLYCLWHIFKNVPNNCFSSLSESDRSVFMHKFSCAAYVATPEAFGRFQHEVETMAEGTKCEGYIADMFAKKEKWAFFCRPTHLTLGMVATKRTEGLFGVAKQTGIHRGLSLCALWDKLRQLETRLLMETERLSSRRIDTGRTFAVKDLESMFRPILDSLRAAGASNYCEK